SPYSVDLDDPPRFSLAMRADQLRLRLVGQTIEGVMLDFLRDDFLRWRFGTAVQPHPETEQRVGNRVALLPYVDEVHVFEPRQVVFCRPGGALQSERNLGQRQRLLLREDVEDRFERAVAARAVQAQLVRIRQLARELSVGAEERRQRADRVGAELPH